MIKYQRKIQDFYKMRDTLIAEGYKDYESIIIYDKIEEREIALEIIKENKVNVSLLLNSKNHWDYNDHVFRAQIYLQSNAKCLTQEEYEFLRKVLEL